MICPECSKNIPEGFAVCPHCGLSLRSIDTINRRQAFRTAQANVRGVAAPVNNGGAVTAKLRRKAERKKKVGVPGRADYIRLVVGLICFILLCLDWYAVKVNGETIGSYSLFGTGRGGLFAVPIFFGVLGIISFLALIINTFVNFRDAVPALRNVDTLRLEAISIEFSRQESWSG